MSDALDRTHLEQLGTRFGGGFLIQLIDLFIVQGRERIAAAHAAAQAGDARGVSAAAHALKSSAGNLGAQSLGARAAAVERSGAAAQDAPALAALVDGLTASFEEACLALQSVRAGYTNEGDR